jgi:tRNA (guanine37-N1)-methyltransferase
VVGRAIDKGVLELHAHDLRDYTHDRHRQVDDVPFGGGPGMVLKPEPIFEAVESVMLNNPGPVILMEPWGERLDQRLAAELSREPGLIIVCGRYEGVDDRVRTGLSAREISVGDYVLSGGELGAAVIVDTVTRLLPGALGNEASAQQESFTAARKTGVEGPDSTCASGGLLDYPHYTRPAEFRGMAAPEVLIGGNHEQIRKWRRRKALEKTLRNRPDLLARQPLSEEDRKLLEEIANST